MGPIHSMKTGVSCTVFPQFNAKAISRREIADQVGCFWLEVQKMHFKVACVIRKMYHVV